MFHILRLVTMSFQRRIYLSISSLFNRLPYVDYVGGVLAMTKESFLKMNGFANVYFRWGGKDDDMNIRWKLLVTAKTRITKDGIHTLNYTLLAKNSDEVTTHIIAEI
ncbi:hypothetical protein DPMN_012482 [Dreissena polymorpha]|uniref:Galactosyltransferase C-terminal domain-containing protein n=1 Tax=Dreissena polymorpha TaxID=45954 RepID=A0A9D4N833_DREPO|nr:hypothetical protein DPMN_012482 [Dreissena polymorpha]